MVALFSVGLVAVSWFPAVMVAKSVARAVGF